MDTRRHTALVEKGNVFWREMQPSDDEVLVMGVAGETRRQGSTINKIRKW